MESDIGKKIVVNLQGENIIEATKLYMTDFVRMSYKSLRPEEEMVVLNQSCF